MQKDSLKPSQNPPGGLKPEDVPQFVSIGFDDNEQIEELNWILKLSKRLKNRNGSKVNFTFYNNGKFHNALNIWKELYDEGHEIGDHSFSHPHGQETDWSQTPPKCRVLMNEDEWKEEIDKNRITLEKAGINPDDIKGFRTPFLEFTDETFKAVKAAGYDYDCSIEEGYQRDMDPTCFNWPYTLDNGSPGDYVCSKGVEGRKPVGSHPGLWEMPVYLMLVPDDDLSDKYNFPKGLRDKVAEEKQYIKNDGFKITGFDWNMWFTDDGRPWLKANEVLAILKYSFDLHYSGNRTPFMFGGHIDIYDTPEKRAVIEDFLNYILEKDDVVVTSIINILKWIKSPTPLSSNLNSKSAVSL